MQRDAEGVIRKSNPRGYGDDVPESMVSGHCTLPAFEKLVEARGGDEGVAVVEIAAWAQENLQHLVALSGFNVGAALLTERGVYTGVNMEIGDLCISMHGEQSAVHHALSSGVRAPFKRIGVNASPCGLCRQILAETCGGEELTVSVLDMQDMKVGVLLPGAFTPATVEKHSLGGGPEYKVTSSTADTREPFASLYDTAKVSCEMYSQAAWTQCPAAVALQVGSEVVCGTFLESVAHNPTINPATGAINKVLLKGLKLEDVTDIVVVYAKSEGLYCFCICLFLFGSASRVSGEAFCSFHFFDITAN